MKKILLLLPVLILLVSCWDPGPKAPSSWTLPEEEVHTVPVTLTCPDLLIFRRLSLLLLLIMLALISRCSKEIF